ncbi:unnamed protein product [Enterobius vermicularis]|uniref:Mannosyltransferase n=1 Tax=Enterobius vermicularis TaxID=51028 RepID=A0A0N4VJY7_ENTVE|nr:unnamed protein product [Enterobius vermicularis]
MHAFVFGLSDYCYYSLAKRLLTPNGARFAMFSYLTSWFVCYCAPRTLSNSLETALMLISFKWYPFTKASASLPVKSYWFYLVVAFFSIFIRPTAILIWFPLGLWHVFRHSKPFQLIIFTIFAAFIPSFLITFVLDSLFYGFPVLTVWNFAKFNVFEGGSEHFGVNSFHWYFSEGLFSVLTVHLFPVILGVLLALVKREVSLVPFLLTAFYVTFHSFLAHKEHRFLLPVIPLLCLYAGHFFATASRQLSVSKLFLCFTLVTVNISLASYFCMYHQSGPYKVSEFIASDAALRNYSHIGVLQLMPCYSMPQYSHLHGFDLSVRALDCSPNLNRTNSYVDEAEKFFSGPENFVSSTNVLSNATYVVAYSKMYERLLPLLEQANFTKRECFFHAHFLTSERQDSRICIGLKG